MLQSSCRVGSSERSQHRLKAYEAGMHNALHSTHISYHTCTQR